jgi:hypothetical protein
MLLSGSLAWAAADDYRETIVVKGLRNPVDKSYRKMVKGMELFDQMHAMAPNASLRYKLLPRKGDTNMDGVALHIVGDSFALPVAVAADHTFILQRHQKALEQDASVRSDRKAHSMTWRTEIRTPGLPGDTRRLGDLRLECHVGMEAGLVSDYPPVLGLVMALMQKALDFCNDGDVPYLFFSERPLFSVTLRAGARRQILSVGQLYAGIGHGRTPKEELSYCDCEALLDRAYVLPLGERSWPDDTVIELEYMDAAMPVAAKAVPADDATDAVLVGKSTKADVIAALGEATVLRFDSGFEVWAYQFGPQKRPFAKTEFVVLFAPSGIVAKTRLRPASST